MTGEGRGRELGVRVVAAPGVVHGFELAGLRVTEAATAAEARRLAVSLASDPDVGVLLVQEELVDDLPALEDRVSAAGDAALVPFPGPAWAERPEAARSYVSEILRRAVGYRVRL